MPNGISLHIGLNYVDPNHYAGWDGQLNACEFDAEDMSLIADSMGFTAKKLIRSEATKNAVAGFLKKTAKKLKAGDILFVTYSGHGGQLPDLNNDEEDRIDETWCLYDAQLADDELYSLWAGFEKGVRILVISDSCHSGTMIKAAKGDAHRYTERKPRFMNHEIASRTYLQNKAEYDKDLEGVKGAKQSDIKASVKLLSGCQDNQYSYDGPFNGQFTGALKRVWNGGSFKGNYLKLHKKTGQLLPGYQTPNYYNIGPVNDSFDKQQSFHI